MTEKQEEARQAPRVIHQFLVRYRPATTEEAAWQVAPMRDFSRTGARFWSERSYEVGDLLELQLILPTSRQPVALKGRVAWVKAAPLQMVELGVTFDEDGPGVKQLIDDAVAHFLRRQKSG